MRSVTTSVIHVLTRESSSENRLASWGYNLSKDKETNAHGKSAFEAALASISFTRYVFPHAGGPHISSNTPHGPSTISLLNASRIQGGESPFCNYTRALIDVDFLPAVHAASGQKAKCPCVVAWYT